MGRTAFLIDGFNLYHSLLEAGRLGMGRAALWLDIRALCSDYLAHAGQAAGTRAALTSIDYFSAVPTHRSRDKAQRHTLYMDCLRGTGVRVHLGRFKGKDVTCPLCKQTSRRHEEKETDVAIAVRLFELCHEDQADIIALVTGDTDLAPAVRICRRLFPEKTIFFIFPFRRSNNELAQLAPESIKMKLRSVQRHQFPDPLTLPNGRQIRKPPHW